MNYLELSTLICRKAIQDRMINFAMEGNVADINPQTIKDYPLFLCTGTGPHIRNENMTRYRLNFFYFDRLLSSNDNSTQIYSTGIEVLANLTNALKNDPNILEISEEIEYVPFTAPEAQVLSDACCGVYSTIEITVANSTTCYIN